MRLLLRTIVVGSAVAGLLSSQPVAAQTADNFLGTWKLNVEQSKYSLGPGPKSLTVTFEKAGDAAVKITATGTAADGSAINTVYTPTYDSKDVPVTGSPDFDTASLKMMDANTRHTVRKKGGKEVQVVHSVVSKDGKQFTATTTGVNAKGEKINSTAVFDKQ
jgi:hypothetical protein